MIERGIYETFHVDGNEAEVLTDSYFELYRLLGTDGMLKLYKHYHGDKIFPRGFIPGVYSIPYIGWEKGTFYGAFTDWTCKVCICYNLIKGGF